MIKRILIWIVPVLALIGGTAAGSLLAPEKPITAEAEHGEGGDEHAPESKTADGHGDGGEHGSDAWFSFPNQFFVPVVRRGDVQQIMVLTLTIETTEAAKDGIEQQEHRLRDALLRSLIIHANTGGFDGNYTAEPKLQKLRDDLLSAATAVAGSNVKAVLIEDLAQSGS